MPAAGEKRGYNRVTNEQRVVLLDLLDRNMSIRQAASQLGINYENAKSIYRIYRLQNRKTKQVRL